MIVVLMILDLFQQNGDYSRSLNFCEAFAYSFEFTIVAESEQFGNIVSFERKVHLIVNMSLRDGLSYSSLPGKSIAYISHY